MNPRHVGVVDRRTCPDKGPSRRVARASVLGLTERVHGSRPVVPVRLAVQVVLADGIGVEHQFEVLVRDPQDLSAESRMPVELGVGLPAVDEPGFDLQILGGPPLNASPIEEPGCV